MRYRPSSERKLEDSRWRKDKRGTWRYEHTQVSEIEFCKRATREPEGFYNGARVARRS